MTRCRPRVLCIEDDPATVDLLVEVLEDEGFETIVATDGVEGIRQLSRHPDLILCDIDMPQMTGFDVLAAFRKGVGRLHNVPFLFITAYGSRESHLRACRLGCDDFIAKPLDFELLVEIIRYRLAQQPRHETVDFSLTEREIEALTWVAKGKSSIDIAALMNVSDRTVNFHVNNVIRKLGVTTRVQAARLDRIPPRAYAFQALIVALHELYWCAHQLHERISPQRGHTENLTKGKRRVSDHDFIGYSAPRKSRLI